MHSLAAHFQFPPCIFLPPDAQFSKFTGRVSSAACGKGIPSVPHLARRLRTRAAGNNVNSAVNGVSVLQGSPPDLLSIPGVGPKNVRKLVDYGIGGVDELKQLYKDKF